jgi:hypothetical protein
MSIDTRTNNGTNVSGERYVRFKEDPSVIRGRSLSNGTTVGTVGSVAGSKTRTDKKVLIIHFQDGVRRIAYTERTPADAIEKSIKRECRLDATMFSLLDGEGDSIVIDGSMEPGEVWLNTETTFEVKKRKNRQTISAVRPVEMFISNLDNIVVENAIQHLFDCNTRKWTQQPIQVKIDTESFASGSLRKAYYLRILSEPNEVYVAKISIDPFEDKETYYQDVETQMYAKKYAEEFNSYKPPKRVDFVMASLLTFPDRPTQSLWALEKHISGRYRKHNNNYGYVSEDERSTPQAFSHFSYVASKQKVLICDIQGVADLYTDPQMHTDESMPFSPGKGNLGTKGFQRFLQTHQCNAICKFLKLPLVNAKAIDMGTRPDTPYMSYQRVEQVNMELYGNGADNNNVIKEIEQQRLLTPQYEVQQSRTTSTPAKQEKPRSSCCNIL